MRQIKLRIYPDGKIEAETHGVKGKACLNYIKIIEQLTEAKTVDSNYTAEYYETDVVLNNDTVEEVKA